jgi:hypothetical protein
MRRVMQRIEQRTAEYAKAPLFQFLSDTSIEARDRLAFAPVVAHFVMSFADLYALVLKEEPARDKYQELVNAHTREDEEHWRWFLSDLAKMGHDPKLSFTDALRFVWGDGTVKMRMLTYHMCRLGMGKSSLHKLALVHCIEATGKVTVQHVSMAGRELAAQSGKRLVYFGAHHFDQESEHTIEDGDVHRMIEEIPLESAMVSELNVLVDEAFEAFTGFAEEMLSFARSGRRVDSP